MAPEVIYLLKVNIGITLFYAFYKLFCNRNTFFNCRRIALLSFLFISFLYPILDIQDWAKEQSSMQTLAGYYATEILPEATVFSTTTATTTRTWNILTLIRFVYIGGIIVLGLRFAIQLFSLIRLALKSRKSRLYGISIRILTHSSGPFSFFRWIFIHPDSMQDNDIEDVLLHEQTHATQWHSIDIIISETACALCWMNPFIWLFKQEVRANLEFLADNTVVKAGYNTRDYQYHLLGLANRSSMSIPTNLSNCFNLSFLKRRVVMMNKQKSKKTDCFKYILFLPLAILLLLISNIGNIARATITATNNRVCRKNDLHHCSYCL